MPRIKNKVGNIYLSNTSGYFIIKERLDGFKCRIEFLVSGFNRVATAVDISSRSLKDPMFKRYYGIGFIGDGIYDARSKAYVHWSGLMRRCYCKKNLKKQPWYKGCKVDPKWHNFQVFAKWFYENKGTIKNPSIDKDTKIEGNKTYGPDKCVIMERGENSAMNSKRKRFTISSPTGDVIHAHGIGLFCREYGVPQYVVSFLLSGRYKEWKGWKIEKQKQAQASKTNA